MANTAKRTKKSQPESFHHLIVTLNYRGTIGRTLLFATIITPVFLYITANLQQSIPITEVYFRAFLVILATIAAFFAYDFTYVTVASNYPLKKLLDKCVLFMVELGWLTFMLLPLIWFEIWLGMGAGLKSASTVLLIAATPIFIVCVRILAGVRRRNMRGTY
jgi:hypothetical protein